MPVTRFVKQRSEMAVASEVKFGQDICREILRNEDFTVPCRELNNLKHHQTSLKTKSRKSRKIKLVHIVMTSTLLLQMAAQSDVQNTTKRTKSIKYRRK